MQIAREQVGDIRGRSAPAWVMAGPVHARNMRCSAPTLVSWSIGAEQWTGRRVLHWDVRQKSPAKDDITYAEHVLRGHLSIFLVLPHATFCPYIGLARCCCVPDFACPAGLGFSPDSTRFYLATACVEDPAWYVYDVADDGSLSNRRVLAYALPVLQVGLSARSEDKLEGEIMALAVTLERQA